MENEHPRNHQIQDLQQCISVHGHMRGSKNDKNRGGGECISTEPLNKALALAQVSDFRCVADLGFLRWDPGGKLTANKAPKYRHKSLSNATVDEIQRFTHSGSLPKRVIDHASLSLPISLRSRSGIA
jgi:hypothetical protein